jgi:PIN domain nuclease of toxin-antitoxin system
VDGVLSNPAYQLVELSLPVVRRSQELYAIPERSDRLLAATAIELECPLITRDARITASGLVPTLW